MSAYTATVRWTRDQSTDFAKGQYSRGSLFRHPELVSGSIFVKGSAGLQNGC
jgi:hypothetical protein